MALIFVGFLATLFGIQETRQRFKTWGILNHYSSLDGSHSWENKSNNQGTATTAGVPTCCSYMVSIEYFLFRLI